MEVWALEAWSIKYTKRNLDCESLMLLVELKLTDYRKEESMPEPGLPEIIQCIDA
jgi:hypothetical protein